MKAIVSVFARDSKGITAYVTSLLAQNEINILDISQTLMQEYFAMIMLVDLADCPLPFHELAEMLKIQMIDQQHLDVRTVTMGINLLDCADRDMSVCCGRIYEKICRKAEKLVKTGEEIEQEFGIPIVNKRISVTPISLVAASCSDPDDTPLALTLDRAAKTLDVNFIGGFSDHP